MKIGKIELTNQIIFALVGGLAIIALFTMIGIMDDVNTVLKKDHHNAEVEVGDTKYRVLNEAKTDRYNVFGYNVDISKP